MTPTLFSHPSTSVADLKGLMKFTGELIPYIKEYFRLSRGDRLYDGGEMVSGFNYLL